MTEFLGPANIGTRRLYKRIVPGYNPFLPQKSPLTFEFRLLMDPSVSVKPARLTRSLLGRSRQGALATLMPESGDPYCSLVNVASL
ncbi:MAG: hypothetical protein ACRCV5_22295, partial [Afipia sp.]